MAEKAVLRVSGTPEVTLASDATSKGRWPVFQQAGDYLLLLGESTAKMRGPEASPGSSTVLASQLHGHQSWHQQDSSSQQQEEANDILCTEQYHLAEL